ncbi:hypothetical protein FRC19_010191 [Serendipita sp. 401]|nr:hypothetical protein FRC19_010191 [Serendipita sp. 401]KAG9051812.1 hypothetical protein FS842_010992 [Serendipita sp. 407]
MWDVVQPEIYKGGGSGAHLKLIALLPCLSHLKLIKFVIVRIMSKKRLQVWSVRFDIKINDDSGSNADLTLDTWKPRLAPGYYYFGPAATNASTQQRFGLIVKELVKDTLVDIDQWNQVWNDHGSGTSTDYALWRGSCADPNYVALASFFTRSHNPPSVNDTQGIKAVHKDVLISAAAYPEIWNDKGTGANEDGSVWGVDGGPTPKSIETGAFIAVSGYFAPPRDAYNINRDKVVVSNYGTTSPL